MKLNEIHHTICDVYQVNNLKRKVQHSSYIKCEV